MAHTIPRQIYEAISSGNANVVRQLLTKYPEFLDGEGREEFNWLHHAASYGHINVVEALFSLGYDINHLKGIEKSTPLSQAIDEGHIEMARYLLSRGADPNLDRHLISAINCESEELGLAFVELLVQHGEDIHRSHLWFDDENIAFTALSWAEANDKTSIADYLRSKGAQPAPESKTGQSPDEIVTYFEENFGPVQAQALIEIVPSDPPIAIHAIPAGKDRNHLTLFTTGMSDQFMTVPEGGEEYQFAELFVQLPADWPLTQTALSDPNFGWPIHWLRSCAKYPFQNQTWLGGPVTFISNGDPPEALAPNVAFTTLLLLAEKKFTKADGRTIQLYRLFPLYTEERDLEIEQGVPALMRAFDRHNIGLVVNLTRQNVAGG